MWKSDLKIFFFRYNVDQEMVKFIGCLDLAALVTAQLPCVAAIAALPRLLPSYPVLVYCNLRWLAMATCCCLHRIVAANDLHNLLYLSLLNFKL